MEISFFKKEFCSGMFFFGYLDEDWRGTGICEREYPPMPNLHFKSLHTWCALTVLA
jgi:hypothetical protein